MMVEMVEAKLLSPYRALRWKGHGLEGVQLALYPLGLSAREGEGELIIHGQPGGEVYRLRLGDWFVLGAGRAEVMSDQLFRGKFYVESTNIYEELIDIINGLPGEYEKRFDHLYVQLVSLARGSLKEEGADSQKSPLKIEGTLMGKEYVYTSRNGMWNIMYDGEMVHAGYETGEATREEADLRLALFFQSIPEAVYE